MPWLFSPFVKCRFATSALGRRARPREQPLREIYPPIAAAVNYGSGWSSTPAGIHGSGPAVSPRPFKTRRALLPLPGPGKRTGAASERAHPGRHARKTTDGSAPSRNLRESRVSRTFQGKNGEGGIRTPGAGMNPLNGLANRRFKPLSHLSRSRPAGGDTPPLRPWQFTILPVEPSVKMRVVHESNVPVPPAGGARTETTRPRAADTGGGRKTG